VVFPLNLIEITLQFAKKNIFNFRVKITHENVNLGCTYDHIIMNLRNTIYFQYFSSVPVLHYLQMVLFFFFFFLLKFEKISWISYTALFKIRRYQRQCYAGKSTWYRPLLKGLMLVSANIYRNVIKWCSSVKITSLINLLAC
jgi:hypothetical protein